jgi:hypothetical protein
MVKIKTWREKPTTLKKGCILKVESLKKSGAVQIFKNKWT